MEFEMGRAPGDWQIFRFGCTIGDQPTFRRRAKAGNARRARRTIRSRFDVYDKRRFKIIGMPSSSHSSPMLGRSPEKLEYLHTDSGIELAN